MPEYLHPVIAMMPDASGQFMRREHYAAGPVRTDTPERERVPIMCQYSHGTHIITYYDGRFRHPVNGGTWAAPLQWAYITWDEPEAAQPSPTPGPVPSVSAGNFLQDTVNLLLKFYKRVEVLDALDRSPWNNPNEGAPEVMG